MSIVQTQLEVCCRNLDICNCAIDDSIVADRIIAKCPPRTYSKILVRTTEHCFRINFGEAAEPSRMIQFQPTSRESAWNLLNIIFQQTTSKTVNVNRTIQGLLGSLDQKDIDAAHSAYWQNFIITIYVSMGGSFTVAMKGEQEAVTQKISGACTLL